VADPGEEGVVELARDLAQGVGEETARELEPHLLLREQVLDRVGWLLDGVHQDRPVDREPDARGCVETPEPQGDAVARPEAQVDLLDLELLLVLVLVAIDLALVFHLEEALEASPARVHDDVQVVEVHRAGLTVVVHVAGVEPEPEPRGHDVGIGLEDGRRAAHDEARRGAGVGHREGEGQQQAGGEPGARAERHDRTLAARSATRPG